MIMKVLSLFDGMSCGRIALGKLGITPEIYVASEIDKYAIKVAKHNYPDTIHMGSVTDLNYENGVLYNWGREIDMGNIDLLMGGSPCQSFSFAGTQKGMVTKDNVEILTLNQYIELKEGGFGFQGQSYLFWEYVRLLNECKPKYFLLENVKMAKKWENIISSILGVEPILINSALVSAQNRQRLYWTNIPRVSQPEDKGILLKDIIESGQVDRDKSLTVTTRINGATAKRYLGKSMHQMIIERNTGGVYSYNGNGPTLTSNQGGNQEIKIAKPIKLANVNPSGKCMNGGCTIVSYHPMALTGITEPTQNGLIHIGNATDINGNDCLKRVYSEEGKAPTLTTMGGGHREPKIHETDRGLLYRKLTPLECERLQTVPDGYTSCVSNSQRYKMLGNGWTVDVISHILSFANLKGVSDVI